MLPKNLALPGPIVPPTGTKTKHDAFNPPHLI